MNKGLMIIGYGNPGRQDDGLGPQFIQYLEGSNDLSSEVTLSANYQLTVEDAYDIAAYKRVLFVDASLDAPAPFTFTPLSGNDQQSIGSHQLHPEAVIQLCQTLYHSRPRAYLLAIRGYHFDHFGEALSEGAQRNLQAALDYIKRWIDAHA